MAEMTANEAIELLSEIKRSWIPQISALIEQQAAEIAKKDRMLDAAEKVCEATKELSDAYARDDIPEAQLYFFWATVDAVLAAWQKTKEAQP